MPTKKEILEMERRTFRNAVVNFWKQRHQLARESLYVPYILLVLLAVLIASLFADLVLAPSPTCDPIVCPDASITIEYRRCDLPPTWATL